MNRAKRLDKIPPYLFGEISRLKAKAIAEGKDLIDLMYYPKQVLMDSVVSFGYEMDGINTEKGHILDQFTPGASNEIKATVSKQERLKRDDPYGLGLAIISMSVVFTALILIYCMLKLFGHASKKIAQRNVKKSEGESAAKAQLAATDGKEDEEDLISGEQVAAIATALHLHFNSMHDEESEVITIDMPSAHYSPWAQKELAMKKTPTLRRK